MMLAGAGLASVALASTEQDSGNATDAQAIRPFTLELNGVDVADWFKVDSLQISDTLGQPMSCQFTLVNPTTRPRPGDVVRVLYYSEVLIAGLMTRCQPTPSIDLGTTFYECESSDWSILLTRRRIRRNFTDTPVANIVDSILDNELAGDGLTIGTIDQGVNIPLVDVKNGRVFDMLRDIAGATGQSMYVDFDKAIQFVSTSNPDAPKSLTYATVEASSLTEDLEGYRNVQKVIVTGTPAAGQDPETAEVTRQNDEQIQARIAIEGGTGRYEEIEEITHPTSNNGGALTLLGIGYAIIKLSINGTPRKTLRCRIRGYGMRAGQIVTVDLPAVNASGTWLIQRATLSEQAIQYPVYEIEATQSSSQIRAYESWMNMVKAGKVIVQMPGSVTSNNVTYDTPGSYAWAVPAGVTSITTTCVGGGGGAGGSDWSTGILMARGGNGGNSGRAVSIISVLPGATVTIAVGAAGTGGQDGYSYGSFPPISGISNGIVGGNSTITYAGAVVCQGNGGDGGTPAYISVPYVLPGSDGGDGSGIGDAVTVGGGEAGGINDSVYTSYPGYPHTQASGQDGYVTIEW